MTDHQFNILVFNILYFNCPVAAIGIMWVNRPFSVNDSSGLQTTPGLLTRRIYRGCWQGDAFLGNLDWPKQVVIDSKTDTGLGGEKAQKTDNNEQRHSKNKHEEGELFDI